MPELGRSVLCAGNHQQPGVRGSCQRLFAPTGQFGARHLDKHLWKLPIPEYDASNETHAALSRLGRTAAQLAEYQLATLTARHGPDWLTDNRVRADFRNIWQVESVTAAEIENAVAELLAAANAPPGHKEE